MSQHQTLSSVSLRDRLRADTREQHERFDTAVAALDLATEADLGDFLATQHAAMATMACLDGPDRAEAEAMEADLRRALTEDLTTLGRPLPHLPLPLLQVDASAMLYILLGSRLGTQVIARHWREAATGLAREAGCYLTLDPRREAWRGFCQRAGDEVATGPRADRVVADARAIFDRFDAALRAVAAAVPAEARHG